MNELPDRRRARLERREERERQRLARERSWIVLEERLPDLHGWIPPLPPPLILSDE